MKVNPLLPVDITISASTNPVCAGLPVTFTATPTNGGTAPTFQWQVNGANTGLNSPVFTYTPNHNDSVTCTLTSSEPCTTRNPVISTPILMIVIDAPEVTFTPCFDTLTTTNAKPILLRGGIPLGGLYSGIGVNSGYFYPSIAGPGNHMISYLYTNSALCSDTGYLRVISLQASAFTCGSILTDIRDGSAYPTVQIGTQCWMAADLKYGTEIPMMNPQRDNCTPEKYESQSTLYQWEEVMQYQDAEEVQGLCPPGWHVPSESDWNILFANWTNSAFAGEPLKYTGFSGFNAFLNGAGFFNKGLWFQDFTVFFWSSTSHGTKKAWSHGMNEFNYSVSYYPSYRGNAFAVRCVRD
jgi:uncharacterized protein (TIGR02145 family)